MTNIKKAFQPFFTLLNANPDATVSDLMPQLTELAAAKSGGGGGNAQNFHRNEAGELLAVKCYYHKLWFSPSEVEFGAKKGTATGLSSMTKDGTSKWNKQLSEFKKASAKLLEDVAAGQVAQEDVAGIIAELKTARDVIVPMEGVTGYETLEEFLAANA